MSLSVVSYRSVIMSQQSKESAEATHNNSFEQPNENPPDRHGLLDRSSDLGDFLLGDRLHDRVEIVVELLSLLLLRPSQSERFDLIGDSECCKRVRISARLLRGAVSED